MAAREGFTVAEKKSMLLSQETRTGLKFTGMFVFLVTCIIIILLSFMQ